MELFGGAFWQWQWKRSCMVLVFCFVVIAAQHTKIAEFKKRRNESKDYGALVTSTCWARNTSRSDTSRSPSGSTHAPITPRQFCSTNANTTMHWLKVSRPRDSQVLVLVANCLMKRARMHTPAEKASNVWTVYKCKPDPEKGYFAFCPSATRPYVNLAMAYKCLRRDGIMCFETSKIDSSLTTNFSLYEKGQIWLSFEPYIVNGVSVTSINLLRT